MTGYEAYVYLCEASKGGMYVAFNRDKDKIYGTLHDRKNYRGKFTMGGTIAGAAIGAGASAIASKRKTKKAVEEAKRTHSASKKEIAEYEKNANKRALQAALGGAIIGGRIGSQVGKGVVDAAANNKLKSHGVNTGEQFGYAKYSDLEKYM